MKNIFELEIEKSCQSFFENTTVILEMKIVALHMPFRATAPTQRIAAAVLLLVEAILISDEHTLQV